MKANLLNKSCSYCKKYTNIIKISLIQTSGLSDMIYLDIAKANYYFKWEIYLAEQ